MTDAENESEIRRLEARAAAAAAERTATQDRIDAENEAEIRRLEARAAADGDDRIDAQNKIEAARVAAINAQIARDNEARIKGATSTSKISGVHIALIAVAAFYFLR
jgi:hypothetical protein